MTEDACRLDDEERRLVETTIREHCLIRNWALHAVNCRSNHLHVVVTADRAPDEVREQLKAWTTRRLKHLQADRGRRDPASPLAIRANWWAERGSKRYLNNDLSLDAAIQYVRDAQDRPH